MNTKIASAVTSVGLFVAAATTSVIMAAPASAVTAQCVRYLQSKNYTPTKERVDYCSTGGHFKGSADKGIAYQACRFGLEGSGVRYSDAVTACNYAQSSQ
ncbi:hypothetical protein I5Q34_01450 [Streptomyces sp. AV19]|uniref:hypothetical protein n=1 Tax=Streptomyces sp. AV19 TaxID=2793068 RepID=UPI0018FE4AD4|nr:hypothetical protein [Streptomyces sp. AV19]MBH1932968.1 hypothetical protein [Streptomyces sp. AV19]MDG4533861.1 hypothetical protein [Streptomyces sp. AV19]